MVSITGVKGICGPETVATGAGDSAAGVSSFASSEPDSDVAPESISPGSVISIASREILK